MKQLLVLALLLAFSMPLEAGPTRGADELDDWIDLVERRSDDFFEIKKRRTTVRKLADEGSDEAWGAVVFALGDPEPMVADEAQIQLARLADPKLLKELFGKSGLKSKDPHVPERVAEALGRMEIPIDAKALGKALGAKDPATRRLLFWSIERLAAEDRIAGDPRKDLRPLVDTAVVRDKDDGVRGAALMALGALDPDFAGRMLSAAVLEPEPEVRCAVAALQGRGLGSANLEVLTYLLDDPDAGVRTGAVLGLARLGTAGAAQALAEHLGKEPSLRLRHRTVARLQELSGLKHKLDPRPWRDWAATLEANFQSSAVPGTRSEGVRESTAQLASLPLRTQHLTLLIDFSGSIWDPKNAIDGRIRKEWLEEQLEATFKAFSVETHFNLIPYTYDPIPWESEAQSAKPRTTKKALTWFDKRKDQGKGNFYDAAVLGLEDRSVDSLIAFTDGAPSGGYHWNMELMVDLLLERNRFRLATFDALLIGTSGGLQRHWKRLASETDGQVILIGEESGK